MKSEEKRAYPKSCCSHDASSEVAYHYATDGNAIHLADHRNRRFFRKVMQHLRSQHYIDACILKWKRQRVSTQDDIVSGIMSGDQRERLVDSDSSNVLSERLCVLFY